ncbi:MAG: hypothetical protein V2J65_04335 [Desulfobacteraceae bacterium]|nr:hypothetical protein [Desulfobacteraceae bacterium]
MESIKGKASRYLLDTHVLLWWLFDDPKLSGTAHDVIQAPDNTILVITFQIWPGQASIHRDKALPAVSCFALPINRLIVELMHR